MVVNWRAVGIGFVVTLVIGLVGGFAVPYTDITIPALSWGVVGLVGGAVAGYVAGGGVLNGSVNGILATTIGALVVLVEPRDAAALADALERLVDDPATAAAMGRANAELVRSQYSWRTNAARLTRLYAGLLDRPDAGRRVELASR